MSRRTASAILGLVALLLLAARPASAQTATDYLNQAYALQRGCDYVGAANAFRLAAQLEPGNEQAVGGLAYALIHVGDKQGAIEAFRVLRFIAPGNSQYVRQLAYLEIEAGLIPEALESLRAAQALEPNDVQLRLQRAYLLYGQGNQRVAWQLFDSVATAGAAGQDAAVLADAQSKARAALKVMASNGNAARGTLFAEYGLSASWVGRYDTWSGAGEVLFGTRLARRPALDAYVFGRAFADGASTTEPLFLIGDNALVGGVGLRMSPAGPGLTMYAEVGQAHPLVSSETWVRSTSARVGVRAHRSWTTLTSSGRPWSRATLAGQVYYDSRFDHVLGVLEYEHALIAVNSPNLRHEIVGGFRLVGDTEGVFYNNVGEVRGGLRFVPKGPLPSLFLGVAAGRYLGEGVPAGVEHDYVNLHATLSLYGLHVLLP